MLSDDATVLLAPYHRSSNQELQQDPNLVMLTSQPHVHTGGMASRGPRNWPLLGGLMGLSSPWGEGS